MPEKSYCVFLSCGTPDNPAQEAFVSAIEAHLRLHNCEPQTVGRSKFSARQPVQAARDLIGTCDGAMVIAFERTRIVQGIDKPNSASPGSVINESHPTIWNQMEASMAYAQRVPILTIIQRGLRRQGMLSNRLEWAAIESDMSPDMLLGEEFRQIFSEWLDYVKSESQPAPSGKIDIEALSIGDLVKSLKPKQLYAIVSAIILALSSVAAVSFKLGQGSKPAEAAATAPTKGPPPAQNKST